MEKEKFATRVLNDLGYSLIAIIKAYKTKKDDILSVIRLYQIGFIDDKDMNKSLTQIMSA